MTGAADPRTQLWQLPGWASPVLSLGNSPSVSLIYRRSACRRRLVCSAQHRAEDLAWRCRAVWCHPAARSSATSQPGPRTGQSPFPAALGPAREETLPHTALASRAELADLRLHDAEPAGLESGKYSAICARASGCRTGRYSLSVTATVQLEGCHPAGPEGAVLAKLSPPRKLTVSAMFRMGDAGRGGFAVRALLHHSPGPALRAPATPQAEWVTRNCRQRRLGTKWESPALVRALRGSILLTCARLHVRKREDDLAARIRMHGWGSRGRRFKSGRPDHCLAGQRPLRQVGEVASRSFDRTLTAGFGGILRHATFMKSGERHI